MFYGCCGSTIYGILSFGAYLLFMVVVWRPLMRRLCMLRRALLVVSMVDGFLCFKLCILHRLLVLRIRHRCCSLTGS
jgi:hypothetical protein